MIGHGKFSADPFHVETKRSIPWSTVVWNTRTVDSLRKTSTEKAIYVVLKTCNTMVSHIMTLESIYIYI